MLYPALISGWNSYVPHGNNESSYMDHGLAMISAVLKQAGHQPFSMDLRSFSSWKHFEDTVKRQSFEMTFVSFFSANERFAKQAVETVKRLFPNKPIVGGGIHLSVTQTREYPNIDAIVLGEGEPHVLDIVNSIQKGIPLKKVYELQIVENLDSLPYVDRSLFNPTMEQTSPLLAGMPEPFITIVAGRGCWGKCKFPISINSWINSEYGFVKMKSLKPNDLIRTWDKQLHKTGKKYEIGNKEIIEIIDERGYNLKLEPDHEIAQIDKDGNLIYKMAKNININDSIILILDSGEQDKENDISLYKAEIIGWILGDGCFSKMRNTNQCIITISDYRHNESEIVENLFKQTDYTLHKNNKITNNVIRYTISSKNNDDLRKHGIILSREGHVDWAIIMSWGKKARCAFLRGLFDSDGSVDRHGNPTILQKDENIINNIQILLLSIGILSKKQKRYYRKNRKGEWTNLRICNGYSINKFKELIGFKCKLKMDKLNKNPCTSLDIIPVLPNGQLSNMAKRKGYSWLNNRKFSRNKAKELFEKTGYKCWLSENIDHITFGKVTKINKNIEEVACIEEPDTQSFIANGILVHNCYPSRNLISGNKIRIRSVDHFMGELIQIKKEYGIGSIMIHDDLLGTKAWMEEFIEKWQQNLSSSIPWWCQLRADTVIRMKEFIPDLADIGLTYVSVGLESGSQRMLDFLDKGTTVEENIEAVHLLHNSGINVFGNYIICLPTETKEDLDGTEKMLSEIKPTFHSASVWTNYPGNSLYKWIMENDYLLTPEEHYSMTRYPYERKIKGIDYPATFRRAEEWRKKYTSELRIPKRKNIKSFFFKEDYQNNIKKPIASIIIVTYNRPKEVKNAIQSIFNQTFTDWELIVLDYTDNKSVNDEVREWATKDNRVKWIWHSRNVNNISYCWNEGLDIAKGKYWCTLDDDNEKYPKYLEKGIAFLEAHPENDTVVVPCDIISDGARSVLFSKPPSFAAILNMNHIDSGQCIHRRTLLEKVGCFDERLLSYDDWDFMLRVHYLNNQSGNTFGWLAGESLCKYWKHTNQRTYTSVIQDTYGWTVPFVRAKTRREKWRIKIVNAKSEITESQKQFAGNTTEAIKSISNIDIVDNNADIVILNGIIYRLTPSEWDSVKKDNPSAQVVALLIEDPQALHMNITYINNIDWFITNDINAYDYYISKLDGDKKKQVILWNNLYLSNKLLTFIKNYDPPKDNDICLIGYAYQTRIDFMRELLPSLENKSIILIGDQWNNHINTSQYKAKIEIIPTKDEIETAKIAMKSKIILLKHRKEGNDFKIVKPGSIGRGYIEAAYRSMVLIDNDREYDSFDPDTIIRYDNAQQCLEKINDVLNNYEKYKPTIDKLYNKATEQFTYKEILLKVINCVRSVRYNTKLS